MMHMSGRKYVETMNLSGICLPLIWCMFVNCVDQVECTCVDRRTLRVFWLYVTISCREKEHRLKWAVCEMFTSGNWVKKVRPDWHPSVLETESGIKLWC